MEINYLKLKEHIEKVTGKSQMNVNHFLNKLIAQKLIEQDLITWAKEWENTSDVNRSKLAVEYGGIQYISQFYAMMDYLSKLEEKEEVTEIVFILDKSGSMQSIKSDAIGGFNSFLQEQKKLEGKTNMTLILFDSDVTTVVNGKDIKEVQELNEDTYVPNHMTALLDAIGKGIDNLNKRISEQVEQPTKVIFAIMTDGDENMSREYTSTMVKNKITNMQNNNDYQFIFLGANIDSVSTASNLGIRAEYAGDFVARGNGASTAMLHASEMVMSYRSKGVMDSYNTVANQNDVNEIILPSTELDIADALEKISKRS